MTNNENNIRKLRDLNKKYDKKTELYLEELSRQSQGTTANSNKNEFIKLDKNGPLFFVSSKGFKRMYIDDKSKPHESCFKYNYKKPKIMTKPNKNTNIYENLQPKRPIQSGEPCGFEGTFVGIKPRNGSSFTKIGYVNEDGELEEYLESKIKNVKSCSSNITEINNDTWNAFLISDKKRNTSPCEYNVDDSRKSLLHTENEINTTISELKPTKENEQPVSNTELFEASRKLHEQNNKLNSLNTRSLTLNALSSIMDKYKQFFYQHLKWILFIIVFLLIGIYGVYRMLKTMVSHTIPESWKTNFEELKSKSNEVLFNQPSDSVETSSNEEAVDSTLKNNFEETPNSETTIGNTEDIDNVPIDATNLTNNSESDNIVENINANTSNDTNFNTINNNDELDNNESTLETQTFTNI